MDEHKKCDHRFNDAERIIETLSKKWVIHIMCVLCCKGTLRYTEIQEFLPDINSRILSERLTLLEEQELVQRNVEDTKPISISYELTEKGKDLKKVFSALREWSNKWN